jgi:hypothetical protein
MGLLLTSGRRDSDARFAECAGGDNRFEGLPRPEKCRPDGGMTLIREFTSP